MQSGAEYTQYDSPTKDIIQLSTVQLQKCIDQENESRWSILEIFTGKDRNIIAFENLLKIAREEEQSFYLDQKSFFQFVNLTKNASESSIVARMRALIQDDFIYHAARLLDKHNLASPANYFALAQLNTEKRKALVEACSRIPECIKDLKLLLKNNLLSNSTVDILGKYPITDSCIAFLKTNTSRNLLPILIKDNLFNEKIISKLSTLEAGSFFEDTVYLLHNEKCLNNEIFCYLLTAEEAEKIAVQIGLNAIVHILKKYNLLNIIDLTYVIHHIEARGLEKLIETLAKHNLLQPGMLKVFEDKDKINFCADIVKHLAYIKSLNKETLQMTIEYYMAHKTFLEQLDFTTLVDTFAKGNFTISNDNYKLLSSHDIPKITQLFELLHPLSLFTNENLHHCLLMNQNTLNKAISLMNHLSQSQLLNQQSFNHILHLLSIKLPDVKEAKVEKYSRIGSLLSRSEFIIDDNLTIYVEHIDKDPRINPDDRYPNGGHGIVKKAYLSEKDNTPKYAFKRIKPYKDDIADIAQETQHQRFLGQEAYYFQRKTADGQQKIYNVTLWKNGKTLSDHDQREIRKYTLATRIKWLLSGLLDLNKLHSRYRVHGDIKPGNFILDIYNGNLSMIDFGATRERHVFSPIRTPSFLPPDRMSHDYPFNYDVYSMGIVAATLFPDLYTVDLKESGYKVIKISGYTTNSLQKAIIKLIDAMSAPDDASRCTIQDAINYTKDLIENSKQVSNEYVKKLALRTIDHKHLTVDDIIHESYRPVCVR